MQIGIVGGSIGGLFAGALLHRGGHRVTVMERSREGLAQRGAGLVAQQELFDVLQQIGVHSPAHIGVEARERITLDREGRVAYRDPTPQTQLSWDHIYELFRAQLPRATYQLGEEVRVVHSNADAAVVETEGGGRSTYDLVIGADGLRSTVREAVDPRHARNSYVGYVTWRGLIPETALPARAAAVLLGRFAFFTAPGAHMLGYLVPGPRGEVEPGARRYNWVWYRGLSAGALEHLMLECGRPANGVSIAPGQLPDFLRRGLVSDAYTQLPDPFARAVEAEPTPFLQAIYDYVPRRMVRDRLALMGDAAAVVRPHTAMGAAKAAGDAMSLARLLGAYAPDEALARYERERLPIARSIAAYGRRLGESIPVIPEATSATRFGGGAAPGAG